MKVFLPYEETTVQITPDVETGDVLTYTTQIIIFGEFEDPESEDGEVVALGRVVRNQANVVPVYHVLNEIYESIDEDADQELQDGSAEFDA
jgi:hypothetical protein